MFDKPIITIEELREWMISLHPPLRITDEVLGWVSCHYYAKHIQEMYNHQDLANLLAKGIPSVNNLESLQDAMSCDSEDENERLIHSLHVQLVAADLLGKYEVANKIKIEIDDLTWWDDH